MALARLASAFFGIGDHPAAFPCKHDHPATSAAESDVPDDLSSKSNFRSATSEAVLTYSTSSTNT